MFRGGGGGVVRQHLHLISCSVSKSACFLSIFALSVCLGVGKDSLSDDVGKNSARGQCL